MPSASQAFSQVCHAVGCKRLHPLALPHTTALANGTIIRYHLFVAWHGIGYLHHCSTWFGGLWLLENQMSGGILRFCRMALPSLKVAQRGTKVIAPCRAVATRCGIGNTQVTTRPRVIHLHLGKVITPNWHPGTIDDLEDKGGCEP